MRNWEMGREHPSSFAILHVQDQICEISCERLEKSALNKDVMYPYKHRCKMWVFRKWLIFRAFSSPSPSWSQPCNAMFVYTV